MTQKAKDKHEGMIRPQLWIPRDLYDLWKSTVYKVNGVDKGILRKTLEETFWFWIDANSGNGKDKSKDKRRKVDLEGV